MRLLPLALACALVVPDLANAGDAYTTRIEPRPYYGATVTLEEGVRVFRALPPHKHVIINPGNQTPVNLSFNETTEKNYHYNSGGSSGAGTPAPIFGGGYSGGLGGYSAGPSKFGQHSKYVRYPNKRRSPGLRAVQGPGRNAH